MLLLETNFWPFVIAGIALVALLGALAVVVSYGRSRPHS